MDVIDIKVMLEEKLREAACNGDRYEIEELLQKGVDINARHSINGWTPLHWACKRGHYDTVALLLKNGADKNMRASDGRSPASVSTNLKILQLLNVPEDSVHEINETKVLDFVPNYLKYMPLCTAADYSRAKNSIFSSTENASSQQNDLVLKIRIANTADPDFIEVEMPKSNLSYNALIQLCCKELSVDVNHIVRLRKLPNTKLRRDNEIRRLQNLEEIEVVLDLSKDFRNIQNSNDVTTTSLLSQPTVPNNSYQSISKKDQVILY